MGDTDFRLRPIAASLRLTLSCRPPPCDEVVRERNTYTSRMISSLQSTFIDILSHNLYGYTEGRVAIIISILQIRILRFFKFEIYSEAWLM